MAARPSEGTDDFTELKAAKLYERLVNSLDPEPFLERLDPAVNYRSQWVMKELTTSEEVAELLRRKIRQVKASAPVNTARIGVATRVPHYGRPLVILTSIDESQPGATVDFQIDGGRITAISICVLPVHKPALLEDPDSYVYVPQFNAVPKSEPVTPTRPTEPDPDPDDIIATFADVTDDLHAPVSDAAIEACPRREWKPFAVVLVPPDHVLLQRLHHPELAEVLERARRSELFLVVISRLADDVVIGLSAMTRSAQPWATVGLDRNHWYMQGGRSVADFGIDYDVWCEMRYFCMAGLIYQCAPIVARPRPSMALPVLHERFEQIVATATAPLVIDSYDLATWQRFLAEGYHAAWHVERNKVFARLSPEKCDRRIAELALEAWPLK
jgi:hypothetical protein